MKRIIILNLTLACVCLAGCQEMVNWLTPQLNENPIQAQAKFAKTGSEILPDKFWLAFKDENLNKLVEQALTDNFSIKQAYDRLKQARAVYTSSRSELYPQLNGTAAAGRTYTGTQSDASEFSLGLRVSYEVDLWGRVRSGAEASELELQATEQDLQAAAISLVSSISQTWAQLIASNAEVKILTEQIELNKKYVTAIEKRYLNGQVLLADLLSQRQLVKSKEALKILALAENKILRQQLAVLLGKTPDKIDFPVIDKQAKIGKLPNTGLPAELVQKRPDVRAAFLRLQSANKSVSQAVAERFPQFTLSAEGRTTSQQLRDLFDNWLANIAANMVAPILDGQRREAEVQRTHEVAKQNLHSYSSTILTALSEVEKAIEQDARQKEYIEKLESQIELSKRVIKRTTMQYSLGGLDYLRVLEALQSHQTLQLKLIQAKREQFVYRINLYSALAGGWDYNPEKLPDDNSASLTQNTNSQEK